MLYCVAPWLRLRVWGVGYQGTDCRGRSPGKIQNTRTNLTSWAGPLALRVVGRAGRQKKNKLQEINLL